MRTPKQLIRGLGLIVLTGSLAYVGLNAMIKSHVQEYGGKNIQSEESSFPPTITEEQIKAEELENEQIKFKLFKKRLDEENFRLANPDLYQTNPIPTLQTLEKIVPTNSLPSPKYEAPKRNNYQSPKIQSTNSAVEKYVKIPQIRNNNPGNLRQIIGKNGEVIKWRGQVDVDSRGFCIFDSLENGFRAAGRNLQDYKRVHGIYTISEVIQRWAPSNENNTQAYIQNVAKQTGYHPQQQLDLEDINVVTNLLTAITRQETGKNVQKEHVKNSVRGLYN